MTSKSASGSLMIIGSSMIIFGMIVGMSISANAKTITEAVNVMDEAPTDGSYTIADTNGQDRRQTKQDCRQENGVVGSDKRDCKQAGR